MSAGKIHQTRPLISSRMLETNWDSVPLAFTLSTPSPWKLKNKNRNSTYVYKLQKKVYSD